PPLNVDRNEYAHFFRESERPGLGDKLATAVNAFLTRCTIVSTHHDDWVRGNSAHFKRGSIKDLLDFGVATWPGLAVDFLDLISVPKVDLVLYGHVHERVEFRLRRDDDGFRYFCDFYTENPPVYRESFDWSQRLAGPEVLKEGDQNPIFIVV